MVSDFSKYLYVSVSVYVSVCVSVYVSVSVSVHVSVCLSVGGYSSDVIRSSPVVH